MHLHHKSGCSSMGELRLCVWYFMSRRYVSEPTRNDPCGTQRGLMWRAPSDQEVSRRTALHAKAECALECEVGGSPDQFDLDQCYSATSSCVSGGVTTGCFGILWSRFAGSLNLIDLLYRHACLFFFMRALSPPLHHQWQRGKVRVILCSREAIVIAAFDGVGDRTKCVFT